MKSYHSETVKSNSSSKGKYSTPKKTSGSLKRRKDLSALGKISSFTFFDQNRECIERCLQEYDLGRFLEKIDKTIKIKWFTESPILKLTPEQQELWEQRQQRSKPGRRPFDPVLMAKVVFTGILCRWSDAETSRRISDSRDVKKFLGFCPTEDLFISRQVIWKYREIFTKTKLFERLFSHHFLSLLNRGLAGQGPLVIDGSFVEAPKQHNSRVENKYIKDGKGAVLWVHNPHKRSHKDIDARWAMKNKEKHYGYKIHTLAETESKFIVYLHTTAASVHDSQVVEPLLNEVDDAGRELYADSAYCGADQIAIMKSFNVIPMVCQRAYAKKPLTIEQKCDNKMKSKLRCRIEHIFGFIEKSMGGSFVRSIGIHRANSYQWATALAYNLCREEILTYIKKSA